MSLRVGSRVPAVPAASRVGRGRARARLESRAAAAPAARAPGRVGCLDLARGWAPGPAPPADPDRAWAAPAPAVWTGLPLVGLYPGLLAAKRAYNWAITAAATASRTGPIGTPATVPAPLTRW